MGSFSFGDVIYYWAPVLVLVVIWFVFISRSRQPSQRLIEISREQVEEAKRLNSTLDRIAAALERDRPA